MRALGWIIVLAVVAAMAFAGGLTAGATTGVAATVGIADSVSSDVYANGYRAGYRNATHNYVNHSEADLTYENGDVYLFVPNYTEEAGYVNVYIANESEWSAPPIDLRESANESLNQTISDINNSSEPTSTASP